MNSWGFESKPKVLLIFIKKN